MAKNGAFTDVVGVHFHWKAVIYSRDNRVNLLGTGIGVAQFAIGASRVHRIFAACAFHP